MAGDTTPPTVAQSLSTAASAIDTAITLAGAAAPFVPNPLVAAGLIILAKYGPEAVKAADAALRNPNATLADVTAIFADLKPYDFFGIPAIAPTKPVV